MSGIAYQLGNFSQHNDISIIGIAYQLHLPYRRLCNLANKNQLLLWYFILRYQFNGTSQSRVCASAVTRECERLCSRVQAIVHECE